MRAPVRQVRREEGRHWVLQDSEMSAAISAWTAVATVPTADSAVAMRVLNFSNFVCCSDTDADCKNAQHQQRQGGETSRVELDGCCLFHHVPLDSKYLGLGLLGSRNSLLRVLDVAEGMRAAGRVAVKSQKHSQPA